MKLILHIGLPKTASTTLQREVFESTSTPDYVYLGKFSDTKHNLSFNVLCDAVFSHKPTLSSLSLMRSDFQRSLLEYEGKTVLVSEEMFAMDTIKSTWQEKLKILGYMVEGLNFEFVIIVRDPFEAIYSLFIETFHTLNPDLKVFDNYLYCNQSIIYNYYALDEWLVNECGVSKIKYLSFEEIRDVNTEVHNNFLQDNFSLPRTAKFPTDLHHNKKVKLSNGVVPNKKSVMDSFSNTWLARLIRKRINYRYYQSTANLLKNIKLTTGSVIPYPDTSTKVEYLRSHTDDLNNFFLRTGINYCRNYPCSNETHQHTAG